MDLEGYERIKNEYGIMIINDTQESLSLENILKKEGFKITSWSTAENDRSLIYQAYEDVEPDQVLIYSESKKSNEKILEDLRSIRDAKQEQSIFHTMVSQSPEIFNEKGNNYQIQRLIRLHQADNFLALGFDEFAQKLSKCDPFRIVADSLTFMDLQIKNHLKQPLLDISSLKEGLFIFYYFITKQYQHLFSGTKDEIAIVEAAYRLDGVHKILFNKGFKETPSVEQLQTLLENAPEDGPPILPHRTAFIDRPFKYSCYGSKPSRTIPIMIQEGDKYTYYIANVASVRRKIREEVVSDIRILVDYRNIFEMDKEEFFKVKSNHLTEAQTFVIINDLEPNNFAITEKLFWGAKQYGLEIYDDNSEKGL